MTLKTKKKNKWKKIFRSLNIAGILCAMLNIVVVKFIGNKYCYAQTKNIPEPTVGIVFGAAYLSNVQPSKYLSDRLIKG